MTISIRLEKLRKREVVDIYSQRPAIYRIIVRWPDRAGSLHFDVTTRARAIEWIRLIEEIKPTHAELSDAWFRPHHKLRIYR